MLGYVPEVKIGGTAYAQTSPILIYLSKQGKMDKLNELEELKSGMMLETVTEVFLGQGRNYIKYEKSIRPITSDLDKSKSSESCPWFQRVTKRA